MTENLKKFLELVSKNDELAAKCGSMSQAELIGMAKEMGIALTEADFAKPVAEELSDDELDTVAGGERINCSCMMGGGGSGDSNDKTCACVAVGLGYRKDGRDRCVCPLYGIGYEY